MELKYVSPYHIKTKQNQYKKNNLLTVPLTLSIHELGFIAPVIVDKDSNVIDGNKRVEVAREMNIEEIPVLFTDMTKEQAEKYYLIANHTQQLAGWNYAAKRNEVVSKNINIGGYYMTDELRDPVDVRNLFTDEVMEPLF